MSETARRRATWDGTDGDTPRIPPFEEIEIDVAGLLPPLEPEEEAG
jgi:hypothetical protein